MPQVTSKNERGVVLALVMVLALLLTTVLVTFARRTVIDATIAYNRDAAAQAEALARGGVRLASALLLEDLVLSRIGGGPPGDSELDMWAREFSLQTEDGGELSLAIRDQGALFNLNSLVAGTTSADGDDEAVEFLVAFLGAIIGELPIPPGERALYDARELAYNLLDYLDPDETRVRGGSEDDWYQRQDPPYFAANRPLFTVRELGRVQGFDERLVKAIEPYVTVYPLSRGRGLNLNTAPHYVLRAALYHGNDGNRRLASDDTVRRILRARQDGLLLCDTEAGNEQCVVAAEYVDGTAFPDAPMPMTSDVFRVESKAKVGDVERTVVAVLDRSDPADMRLLRLQVR